MAEPTIGGIIVEPNGVSHVIDITLAGTRPTAYTTRGGPTTHTFPVTVSARTGFHLLAPGAYVVSALRNGAEVAADGATRTVEVRDGTVTEITVGATTPAELAAQDAAVLAGGVTFSDLVVTNLHLGAAEAVTLDEGVATVTQSYVRLSAESDTTDQLDTITKADAADGDLLLLTVAPTHTITVDDAEINLGAATRAVAPGGSLLLLFDGTEWTELHFTAGTDNT